MAHFLERTRSASDPEVLAEHLGAIHKTLGQAEKDGADCPDLWLGKEGLTQAGWDLGVALEYLELRLPELNWRAEWPGLTQILEQCRTCAAFRETRPPAA